MHPWLLLLGLFCASGAASVLRAQDDGADQEAAVPTLQADAVRASLEEARAQLGALPADSAEDSPEALLRQAWEIRVKLLEKAIDLLDQADAQVQMPGEAAQRRTALDERRAKLDASGPPVPRESATEEGFVELGERVAAQRKRVTDLRDADALKSQEQESLPTELADARASLEEAGERSVQLRQEAAAAGDPEQKQLLELRAENAELNAQVAGLQIQVLERDRELEKTLSPLRTDELEVAEQVFEGLQEEYRLYSEALQEVIEQETDRLQRQVEELEAALEAAADPTQRFLVSKQLAIARFEKNDRAHGRFLLSLSTDLEEQTGRLAAEKFELESLQEYLEKAGTGPTAAERIKFTLQRVKMRRQALRRTLSRDVSQELTEPRARRFELEDQLFVLRDDWKREVDAVALELAAPAAEAFRAEARALFEPYRTALRGERDLLTEVIEKGQDLQVELILRREALDELEAFIRSKVFWLRDGRPLGPSLLSQLPRELGVVKDWLGGLGSAATRERMVDSVKSPGVLVGGFFVLLLLPFGLFVARQRLRRVVTRMNDRTVRNDAGVLDRVLAVGTGVVSVALLPAYVFLVSRMTGVADLPAAVAPVLTTGLGQLALFLFFLLLSRSFFAGRGTAQVQFGMDQDAAHTLHQALRIALFGFLAFFTLRTVLSRPPFLLESLPLEALPRLAYTAFLASVLVALVHLFRPRSAFSRYWASALGDNFLGRRWPVIGILLGLAGAAIVVLDVLGYRYGAGVLAVRLGQSLVALLLVVPLYKGVVAALATISRRRRASRAGDGDEAGDEGEDPAPSPDDEQSQFRKFLRVLFVVGTVVLIAGLWGIDSQAFDTLDMKKAYDIQDSGEGDDFVSWGHVLRSILYLLGTYLLLKHLPGIYEYAIFPRLEIDAGLKYAVLTMSRYGVFAVGILLALSAIKLDLGRLQWLMAAIGVGLGFGLQEIVSNFVSGIILLVERPVRVGDVVTVGATSGKVQRINIRATTVLNFDRQEIIVPNRSLITKEVTNWTRGDTIIRLVVPIGVAYGSDVDQVTDLLMEIAREQPEILQEPAAQALFLAHGESSLDFELRVFIPDPSVKMPLLHRLNRTINRRLDDLGIEIPFPQRDLHIRSSTVPWPAPDPGTAAGSPAPERA